MKQRDEYYTISEAAKVIGRSIPTIYRWVRSSKLPALRNPVTGRLIVNKEQSDELARQVSEWD